MDEFRKPPEPMPELSGVETLVRGSIEVQVARNITKMAFGETKGGEFVPYVEVEAAK